MAGGAADRHPARAGAAGVLAIVQILAHLRYFLQLDLKTSPRENLLALAFAAVPIFPMLGGNLWIMLDPHTRMTG